MLYNIIMNPMTLFFSLLPIYVFGNLHCAGMCGPLVMLLAKHPFRWFYFLGRLISFSVVGLLSAEAGMAFFYFLAQYHISASLSLFFGVTIALIGFSLMLNVRLPGSAWLSKKMAIFSLPLTKLMTQHSPFATLLFGACTILLPCGQTVVVFSIIALSGEPLNGLFNGFAFALLTSPSLIAAMHATTFFQNQKQHYHLWMGAATLLVGVLAILRGVADFNFIPHWILNPSSASHRHIVLF